MRAPLISVVVCTYNRANLLTNALETLCQQTLTWTEYEVIVVDNKSTDTTIAVSQALAARYPQIRFCSETQQGLSHARNRGWQMAQGDYVAYMDDDCKAPEQWLATARQIIHNLAPAAFGGPYFAFYATPKPVWFKDSYGSSAGSDQPHPCSDTALAGTNLFIQRRLLAATGGFDPTFGMRGDQCAYGEENELLQRLRLCQPGALIYYDPALYVYHLVRPEKMRLGWQLYSRFVHGQYGYRVAAASAARLPGRQLQQKLPRQMARFVTCYLHSCFGLSSRSRARYPYYQQFLMEEVGLDLQKLGWLFAAWQQRMRKNS